MTPRRPARARRWNWPDWASTLVTVVIAGITGLLVITSRLTALETKVDLIYSALIGHEEVKPAPLKKLNEKNIAKTPQ